jgi:hypothetical protein
MDEACQYCEETAGYKIIGAVIPYEGENVEPDGEDAEDVGAEEAE